MIPDAVFMPIHLIPLQMGELPKDKEIILYCRSRCPFLPRLYLLLMKQEFGNVTNLQRGIIGWARGGFEVVRRRAV